MTQFAAQRPELRHVPHRHEHSEHHICYELPGNSHPSGSSQEEHTSQMSCHVRLQLLPDTTQDPGLGLVHPVWYMPLVGRKIPKRCYFMSLRQAVVGASPSRNLQNQSCVARLAPWRPESENGGVCGWCTTTQWAVPRGVVYATGWEKDTQTWVLSLRQAVVGASPSRNLQNLSCVARVVRRGGPNREMEGCVAGVRQHSGQSLGVWYMPLVGRKIPKRGSITETGRCRGLP